MKMFIPTIGTEFKLSEDWSFTLWDDSRNEKLIDYFGIDFQKKSYYDRDSKEVQLLKGTIIKVDRIYIRKGGADYDSVTVWATIPNVKNKKRFWVKLNDFNNIYAEEV